MDAPLFPLTVPEAIARIEARDPTIRAFVNTRLDRARREYEQRSREPARSPLHAVPFSLKDEWETRDLPTTGGSWRHRDRVGAVDSAVRRAIEGAGAILLGKTNLSDLGLAPEASSWVGGQTRNPHDLSRTAGGSSGGAAAAVADGMSALDWGTDIGGSIRMPAGFCGVPGLKLAAECWPITDLFPSVPAAMTWMCSQGPLARTMPQLRAIVETLAPALKKVDRGGFVAKEAVLVVPDRGGRWEAFAEEVGPALAKVLGVRSDHGLPPTKRMRWIYNGVWCSHFADLFEADPTLTFWPGMAAVLSAVVFRGALGDRRLHPLTAELLLQIAIGRALVFRDRASALDDARTVKDGFERIWERGGVAVMPLAMWPAPPVGWTNMNTRLLECTVPGNLADATGLTVPWDRWPGTTLPRAIQLLGPPGSELALLDLAERLAPSPS